MGRWWVEGLCRSCSYVLHICIPYLYRMSLLRVYLYCIDLLHIVIAYSYNYLFHILIAHLHCIYVLHTFNTYMYCMYVLHISITYLYCIPLLCIFIAYLYCTSVLHIFIAFMYCISVLQKVKKQTTSWFFARIDKLQRLMNIPVCFW